MSQHFASFDPQRLPLQPADVLPAPQAQHLEPGHLRQRMAHPPAWQPDPLAEKPWFERPLTPSAVLLALVDRPQGLQVLLTQRASALRNHAGQIAFAGGRIDATDADATACALREAQEEIGLAPQQVQVLGALPPYITGTAFSVTPVLALVAPDHALQLNTQEVDSAFEIPLAHLLDPAQHFVQHWEMEQEGARLRRSWYAMPSVDAHGHSRFVWGASAGMLRNLLRFVTPPLVA